MILINCHGTSQTDWVYRIITHWLENFGDPITGGVAGEQKSQTKRI